MTQFNDKAFIANPGKWPNWPLLPVKRHTKDRSGPECGILIDNQPIGDKLDPEHKSLRTIFLTSMFALKKTDLKTVEKKEYESVEKMLADGWIVD